MAQALTTKTRLRLLVAVIVAVLLLAGFIAYQRYDQSYVVAKEEDGSAVTKLITARLTGMSSLKVAELSGTIQSTASDIRGFGWLRSDQVVKMPYSVDYFVDVSRIGPNDVEWLEESRTLIVNAPDISVSRPNTDEGQRTLVRTTGLFVTRKAGEELSRRTSIAAARKAQAEALSPERLAQAREHARRAVSSLMAAPLGTLGYGDARVIVTFPAERPVRDGERWDQSRRVEEVLKEKQPAR
jgi:hypothetical protein